MSTKQAIHLNDRAVVDAILSNRGFCYLDHAIRERPVTPRA